MTQKCFLSLLASLSLLIAGCVGDYERFYYSMPGASPWKIAALRANPPPATPIVEHAPSDAKALLLLAYLKRGYAPIGYSRFSRGDNSVSSWDQNSAVRQGRKMGADLVLIVNPKYIGSVTYQIPRIEPSMGSATIWGSNGGFADITTNDYKMTYESVTQERFEHGAIYFVKRHSVFGVICGELNDAERQKIQSNKGVVVRVVIDNTPAFNADILVGDIITAINGKAVTNAKDIKIFIHEHAGEIITVSIVRQGQHIEKTVQLNRLDE